MAGGWLKQLLHHVHVPSHMAKYKRERSLIDSVIHIYRLMQVGSNTLQTILGLSKNKDVIVCIFTSSDTEIHKIVHLEFTMC